MKQHGVQLSHQWLMISIVHLYYMFGETLFSLSMLQLGRQCSLHLTASTLHMPSVSCIRGSDKTRGWILRASSGPSSWPSLSSEYTRQGGSASMPGSKPMVEVVFRWTGGPSSVRNCQLSYQYSVYLPRNFHCEALRSYLYHIHTNILSLFFRRLINICGERG
jgi:hypothetical protein